MTVHGSTRILGIFGDPVAHSLSPLMQNAALAQVDIDALYVPFHVRPDALAHAVAGLRALDIWGVNVTVPHKERVCQYLDQIDTEAQLIGAVNTIVNRDGELIGYNTDGRGLIRSLRDDLDFVSTGKRILLLGAGGACRAALVALGREKAAWIGVANRTPSRSEALVGEFADVFTGTTFATYGLEEEDLSGIPGSVDLLINTSSVGLKGEAFVCLPWQALDPAAGIYDMVYGKAGTPLVREARSRGYRAADGLGMLAAQGEEAFFHWTGVKPPSGVMKSRILAHFAEK